MRIQAIHLPSNNTLTVELDKHYPVLDKIGDKPAPMHIRITETEEGDCIHYMYRVGFNNHDGQTALLPVAFFIQHEKAVNPDHNTNIDHLMEAISHDFKGTTK